MQLDKIEGVFERPSDEVIRELSRALRQALGVSLFGIDIIINNQTGQHAVIDINAFPGKWWGQEAPSAYRPVTLGDGRVNQRPPTPYSPSRPRPHLQNGFIACGEVGK